MTCLEHLIENTLTAFEKGLSPEEITSSIQRDPNLPHAGISAEQCHEICQYLFYTYLQYAIDDAIEMAQSGKGSSFFDWRAMMKNDDIEIEVGGPEEQDIAYVHLLDALKDIVSCLEFREMRFPDGHTEYAIYDDDCQKIAERTISQDEYELIKHWLEEEE